MIWVMIICIIIAVGGVAIAAMTTTKAYEYKHKIDPVPEEHKQYGDDKNK